MTHALRRFDLAIIIPSIALVSAGILMLSTTGDPGQTGLDHKAVQQGVFVGIGLAAALIMAFLDYRLLSAVALPAFIGGTILLAAVVVVGDASLGARRWFVVGPIVIQPSEIMKLAAIVFLAHFLSRRGERVRSIRTLLLSLLIVLASRRAGVHRARPGFGAGVCGDLVGNGVCRRGSLVACAGAPWHGAGRVSVRLVLCPGLHA